MVSNSIDIMRRQAREIFDAAIKAVDPMEAVERHLNLRRSILHIGKYRIDLNEIDRIFVVGAGKAVAPMAKAIESVLAGRIAGGAIVVKDGHGLDLQRVTVYEAGHPVPDVRGVRGTQAILDLVQHAAARDLVICVMSGGGSALMIAPVEGVSLADKQKVTKELLASGASIHEINTIRKHLSQVKGGRLAEKAHPATVASLILSDVVGDELDVIASGPTVPDSSTFDDAQRVLKRYGIWDRVAAAVRIHIQKGCSAKISETPKRDDDTFHKSHAVLVGTNLQALEAAAAEARRQGFRPLILSSKIEGEAREVAKAFAAIGKEIQASGQPVPPPACILAGGETTVTLRGNGRGGRNQEFALAAAMALDGNSSIVALSAGSDGTDGPTDAAGAIVDGNTVSRAVTLKTDPRDHLNRNDSYTFFRQLDDLLMTGPTRTNVMDIYMLLCDTTN